MMYCACVCNLSLVTCHVTPPFSCYRMVERQLGREHVAHTKSNVCRREGFTLGDYHVNESGICDLLVPKIIQHPLLLSYGDYKAINVG